MKEFDLWVYTTRKTRHFALLIEDDEIVETVMLESESENVSLIAKLQEKIDDSVVLQTGEQSS